MPMCIVKGCMNRSSMKNRTQEVLEETVIITFHTLPKNESRRQLWLTSLEVNELSLPKQAVVCSVHFRSDDFDTSSLVYRRLKSHAIPYVQIPEDTGERRDTYTGVPNEESSSFSLPNKTVINNSYIFDKPVECVSKKHSMDSISTDEPLNKVAKLKSPSKNECLQTLQEIDESVQVKMSCVDKSTCISPKRLFFSPRKEQLRRYAANMKRSYQNQLKLLKQKYKRMSKKCASMETILHSLEKKNLLQGEHVEALRGISNFNIGFCQRLKKKSAKQPVARMYSLELRLFALTLHYYSPRAYSYVRKKFNSCIPHPKTLYKWYRSIDGEPGFNNEAIRHITEYNKSIQDGLYATLVIDEMAIRQQIEFTGTGHSGVVDVGKVFECDTENIAKEALVFLLVGLNRAWKIPVGYFLIQSINGEQKCNLVQQCLKLLHETGVNVVCLTCDGAGSNITMAKALGWNFTNPQSLQTHFPHPMTTEPVYFMLDPCHLLKLIRNTLGDYKCILNPTKERVEWKYIGLHLGNKLNKRHIEYHKNKMKVKYAVQVLSSSVSHAICICRTGLQLTQFRDSRATEEFISLLNDLFDILNSRNLRQQKYKRPINPENYLDIEKNYLNVRHTY